MDVDNKKCQSHFSPHGGRSSEHSHHEDEQFSLSNNDIGLGDLHQLEKAQPDIRRSSRAFQYADHTTRVVKGHHEGKLAATACNFEQPRSMSPAAKAHIKCYREPHIPKGRSQAESAAEKAVGTAAAAIFRIRNDSGSWFGEKGLKVATAAVVSASIDFLFAVDKKKHPFAHIAVSVIQGAVMDYILNDDEDDSDQPSIGAEHSF